MILWQSKHILVKISFMSYTIIIWGQMDPSKKITNSWQTERKCASRKLLSIFNYRKLLGPPFDEDGRARIKWPANPWKGFLKKYIMPNAGGRKICMISQGILGKQGNICCFVLIFIWLLLMFVCCARHILLIWLVGLGCIKSVVATKTTVANSESRILALSSHSVRVSSTKVTSHQFSTKWPFRPHKPKVFWKLVAQCYGVIDTRDGC